MTRARAYERRNCAAGTLSGYGRYSLFADRVGRHDQIPQHEREHQTWPGGAVVRSGLEDRS